MSAGAEEQTETKDFLAKCVVSATGNPVLEQIREKGAEALLAVYRLVKNVMVHSLDNDAVTQTIAQSHEILKEFSALVGNNISVTFVDDTIFVCGQLLRASRMVYESAIELGGVVARCGVSEITIQPNHTAQDLYDFAAALSLSLQDPTQRHALIQAKLNHMSVRKVEAALQRRDEEEGLPTNERILRLYATSLVVMRQFFDSISEGSTILPYRVKRLAQRFVSLSESGDPALLGMTCMANAHRDDAGRAVQTCILALALTKQISTDRVALARVSMAALMADVGRVQLAGPEGRDRFLALPDDVEISVPPVTSAATIATGGVNPSNAHRTVIANETTWAEREALLGPPYGRALTPLVEAQILRLVRTLLDQLAPRDATVESKAPLEALQAVATTPGIDPALIRLLVGAIGLLPVGSVVTFETGEWGVVVSPSRNPEAFDRPVVRLVTDRKGNAINPPKEVDLGTPGAGKQLPRIANVLPPDQAQFNVTGVFVGTA